MAAVTTGSDVTAGEPTLVIMMTLNERLHFDGVMEGIHALGDSDLHVLCVDDDSLDGTWRNYGTNWAAENAQYHLLRRTGRFKGQGSAMRDGIQWAVDNEKDFTNIVVIAGNQTDDPAHIPAMLGALRAGADVVVAQRSGKSAGALTRMATGAPFVDVESGFRAYRLAALQKLHFDKISLADHRIKTELLARAKRAGCTFDTVDVEFKARPEGAEMRGGTRGALSSLGLFLRRVTGLL
jgi:dolichol-phosphate mannosyltransferase